MRNPVRAEFLSALHLFGCFALTPSSLWRADGSVLAARRLASDVAFNIMNAPVIGSPVMDEVRRQAKEPCLDRRALLAESSATPITIQIMIPIVQSSARMPAQIER